MPVEPKPVGEGNLEDSVMKGVSSLLKMKEGWRKVAIGDGSDDEKDKAEGLGFVLRGIDMNDANNGDLNGSSNGDVVEGSGNGLIDNAKDSNAEKSIDDKDEEIGDDEYSIGDFVWGKVKSHPWWPGQIHDPSNASDCALKLKQEGKFLVAYFGDETFAWCSSSQLNPFSDQFNEMVKQNKSMNFVKAVEAAVEEIGRFVSSKMTCSCYKGAILDQPIVINSGLKENVRVPDLGLEKLPIHQPLDLLTILKTKARSPHTASNLLEISTLKNWVLAFYRSKGVYSFAEYSEPKVIEGLEDLEKDAEENGAMGRNRRRGPVEEDEWLKACSSGNGRVPKRKQKSIAEILQIEKTQKSVRQTRKVANLTESAAPISKIEDTKKKRKSSGKDDAEESPKSEDLGLKGFASRERKKSKYLSSPYKNPTKLEGKSDAVKVSRVLSSDGDDDDDLKDKKNSTSAKDVLSEIQTLSADPDFSKKTESFSLVEKFLRAFRISVNSANDASASDLNGERLMKNTWSRKSKNIGGTDSETRSMNKRIKKNEDDNMDIDTPIINLIGSSIARRKKKKKKRRENQDLGARLLVSFGRVSSLPSKEDLTTIYSKFGPLNKSDTRMYDDNFCGVVAFERTADAESALISSQKSNPFGRAGPSFVLRYLSPNFPSSQVEEPSAKVVISKTAVLEDGKEVGEMEFLKKKLEDMSSLLEKSSGKLSKKMRSKLEGKLKGVLETLASSP